MSYLKLVGEYLNLLETPLGTDKEGKPYGGKHQLQLLCRETLRNQETRMALVNLYIPDPALYQDKGPGEILEVPVGIFVPNGGKFSFFTAKQ